MCLMDKHSYSDWLSLALNRSRNALWEEGFPWKDIAAFIFLNVHVNNQTHHSAYLHRSHYVSGIHIDYMFTLYTRLKQYTSEYIRTWYQLGCINKEIRVFSRYLLIPRTNIALLAFTDVYVIGLVVIYMRTF